METYKNIKLLDECCPWFKYDKAIQHITCAVSHIAISIIETHSTEEHIDLIQNLVHELHIKLLDYNDIKADCCNLSCLQLIEFCFPKHISLSAVYVVGTMAMILKYLEEKNIDKVKLLDHITEECDRLELLLSCNLLFKKI